MDNLRAVAVFEDVGIVMPDGVRLSARIWRPVDAGAAPVPAILEYIPYRKRDGTVLRDEAMHPWFAARGYACLRVDIRGNGDSGGVMTDEYTAQELDDACSVIAWAAAQPWCTGAVGMMGKSWGGFNCLQTAALRPPALRAVIAVCATTDRFADDIHFKGGCLMGANFAWESVMLSYSSRPADPALRADWRADWLRRLAADASLAPRWAGHQARDDYWRHGSVCEDWAAITVPVLAFGGWADGYMNTVAALVGNLPGVAKGVVGPWVHQYPHQAVPGPAIGFLEEACRWWDRWLKDVPNGAEGDAAYRVWMLDSAPPDACAPERPGRWCAVAGPMAAGEVLALSAGGVLGGAGGRVGVRVRTPQTLGLAAGEYFPIGLDGEMAADQRGDDALSVCFDSAVLDAPFALLGAAEVRARVCSDQPRAFLVARLCDVAPDGASVRIAHGMLNLCHHMGSANPSEVPIGLEFDITIRLDQMAYALAPGHRLRLALSTTYWPFLWPSPQPATVTVVSGTLALPVMRDAAAGWAPPPPSRAPARGHAQTAGQVVRRVEHDLITGFVTLVIATTGAGLVNADHGLATGFDTEERWTIHPQDPQSARAEIRWRQYLSRGLWSVETQSTTQMQADSDTLMFSHHLRASEGDVVVHDHGANATVRRRFV